MGEGASAEWLGSVAFDGYDVAEHQEGIAATLRESKTREEFLKNLEMYFAAHGDDATLPDQGWPWPWNNSHTTDLAYCFVEDRVKPFSWGRPFVYGDDSDLEDVPTAEFPNMSDRQNVTFGSRSGILVLKA